MRQSILSFFLLGGFLLAPATKAHQQANAGLSAIVFSELLPDPNGAAAFDTDRNGTATTGDEFVEFYNISTDPVDMSGWQLWDKGNGLWFTFPDETILHGNRYIVIVANIASDGKLPTVTNGGFAFDAEVGGNGILNNSGDNVVLLAPNEDQYRQLYYGNTTADDPTTYDDFPATATPISMTEAWGRPLEGVSLVRVETEQTQFLAHTLFSDTNASPGTGSIATERVNPRINEFVVDHRGADVNEFVEVTGDPEGDYRAFTLLQIEGDNEENGRIDSIHPLQRMDVNGFWSTGYLSSVLENGTLTFLLVEGFTGYVGDDIDTDDDQIVDTPRWVRVVDAVAVWDGDEGDLIYATIMIEPNEEIRTGGASLLDGEWQINDYNGNGLSCCTDTNQATTGIPNTPLQANKPSDN